MKKNLKTLSKYKTKLSGKEGVAELICYVKMPLFDGLESYRQETGIKCESVNPAPK